MKQLYFFLTVLFLIQPCSFAQQNKLQQKVFTKSKDILTEIVKSYKSKNVNDSKQTIVSKTVLANGYVLETKMGQYWNENNWVNSSKDLFTYTPEGLKTQEINQLWNNGNWENSRRFLTTYYLDDLVSLYEEQTWNGAAWENSYKYVSSYDNNNRVIEYNVLQWNSTSWDSSTKATYIYSGSGNLERRIEQSWNGTGWNNNYKYSFQYNSNNEVSEKLEEQWFEGSWKNSIIDVFTYNSQNELTLMASFWWPDTAWKESVEIHYAYDSFGNVNERLTKFWESEILGVQNKYYTTYEYLPDTSLVTKVENQEWNLQSAVWVNTSRDSYIYNTEKLLEKYLSEGWDGSSTWLPGLQENYTYDENGNLDTLTTQSWNGTEWVNVFRIFNVWSLLVSVDDGVSLPSAYSLEQNYPNPFNPNTRILFILGFDAEVSLTLYDILGNEITRLVDGNLKAGKHEVQLNAGKLASGVYFYCLNAFNSDNKSSFSSVKKMTLLK